MIIATLVLALGIDLGEVLRAATRAFHGQRCGVAVDIGGGYGHGACHLKSEFHPSAQAGAPAAPPVTKGWHDAGDYGRYVTNSGITTATLLMSDELFPDFAMGDEIRWNLEWMLSMQDADGGVWHKQTSLAFPGYVMPEDDASTGYVIGKGSCATANLVAVASIAARTTDPAHLAAGRRGWKWLRANPNVTFRNPPDVKTGEYGDGDCSDETLWAAVELWRASKDEEARAYIDTHLAKATMTGPPSWADLTPLAVASLALAGHAEARRMTIAAADAIVDRASRHRWRIPMIDRDYVWGSNGVLANYGVQLLLAYELKADRRYIDAARDIVSYLLGRNPLSMSFVTGFGDRRPLHPHHRPSVADGIVEPWPGLLVGGPNRNRQDPVMATLPPDTPPDLMYVDHVESYATNEVAINWNAALVFLLAGVLDAEAAPAGRVAVYARDGFPTADAPPIPTAVLDEALRGLSADRTSSLTSLDRYGTLVLPYGSAFPLAGWPHIRAFIARGGNLVVLGGAPFHQPVLADGSLGVRQPTWAHELLIGPADEVVVPEGATTSLPQPSWRLPVGGARKAYALTLRLARQSDMPGEHGSEGPREAVVRPLVHIVSGGLPRATPLIEIDRIAGPEKGGRWIFASSDAPLDAKTIRAIVVRAMRGSSASAIEARPLHATISAGEKPRIVISRPASVVIRDDGGGVVHRQAIAQGTTELAIAAPLAPGLYHVEVDGGDELTTTTGFWVRDAKLLASFPKVTVSRDWLRLGDRVMPVVGTTYMSSTVQRQFLFEPNPHVWDRDFAQMKALGINFVRTGLWTAWSRGLEPDGTPREEFLRALDAYVHTAAKHGIVVNFTFYAFQPLWHGGSNPYIDPTSLEDQRRLVTAVAARYRGVNAIHYDLINEPSYSPANQLWSNRPIRDAHERHAWTSWVRRRHGSDETLLRSRWQDRSDDLQGVPRENELWHAHLREDRRPRKVRDFVEFTNEVAANWARTLRGWIREAGGDVLVTLGQDEGGTQHRPSQQLHADAVDYTCLHPWWQNDDVLANGVFIKVPEKPSLFQETGIMRLENIDGWHWRPPELAASLLDRKFASAFAARAAGNVQWAWNINPYMPIDNESVIGFFRPDGTAKPELEVVRRHAEFFGEAAAWLDDFEPDAVVIVIPQSRLFLNRPAALDGYRRAIRIMAERFGVVPTALSDMRLSAERLRGAKLVVVPSAEVLSAEAAAALLAARRSGTKVLFTGAVTGDFYGEVPQPLRDLGIVDEGRPVAFREERATFDRSLQESLLRSTLPRSEWHEPLPLEHAREEEPFVELMRRAFASAGVQTHPSDSGVTARLLYAPRAVFGVFINDGTSDAVRRVVVAGRAIDVPVPAGGSRLVLFDRTDGRIITRSR